MAKRRRTQERVGAPDGNLNAARHPARTFWSRRALRAQDAWATHVYRHYLDDLLTDKPDPSAAELRIAEIASAARTCQALMLADIKNVGRLVTLPDGRTDVSGLVKELRQFMALERSALESFGTEKQPRPAKSLGDIVGDITARKAADGEPDR